MTKAGKNKGGVRYYRTCAQFEKPTHQERTRNNAGNLKEDERKSSQSDSHRAQKNHHHEDGQKRRKIREDKARPDEANQS